MTAQPTESFVRRLTDPSPQAAEALRGTMLYCFDRFASYQRAFGEAGIERATIRAGDPFELVAGLPIIGSDQINAISAEAVTVADSIVDTESSSGTAGGRKTRYLTYDDDRVEHEFLARLIGLTNVGPSDRVACVDTDPAAVMVSFPRACELLGTRESYCVSTGTEFGEVLEILRRLQPTVLISVPSIILRMLGEQSISTLDSVHTVIHIGEGMSPATRNRVGALFGAEVYSYYGSSETSGLGIECSARAGIHLMSSRHYFEIDSENQPDGSGDLIVTTLEQYGLPLLRYRLGDLVRVRSGPCRCGLSDPRVDVLGRSQMFASILGSKIHHAAILGSLQRCGFEGPLQVILDVQGRTEAMTLRVSDSNRELEATMKQAVLSDHTDVEFLVASGLLQLRVELCTDSDLLRYRKAETLVDLRGVEQTWC